MIQLSHSSGLRHAADHLPHLRALYSDASSAPCKNGSTSFTRYAAIRTLCCALIAVLNLSSAFASVGVIPHPNAVTPLEGTFDWSQPVCLELKGVEGTSLHDLILQSAREHGLPVREKSSFLAKGPRLRLERVSALASSPSPEAYELEIVPHHVRLVAQSEQGLWYGWQTLVQLRRQSPRVAACRIVDAPRFAYRSFMLDVSRHFFSLPFIKKQIDMLSALKFNHLQLHLTDAAGWRMEIKKYPRLTQVGAFRSAAWWKTWWNGDRKYVDANHEGAYGGYYTQRELKDLVQYAAARGITIVPEIEMPGHSEEVLTAYPELSCTHEPYGQADFCAGNEQVFTFLTDVLKEVMEVFPSRYIHIGGDEAGKQAWKSCPLCQKRMRDAHLTTLDELQSDFIHRIDRFLTQNGRKLMGWDEIVDGGLSPNATVLSWRGEEGAIKAAALGHDAIMVPGEYLYFDFYQDAPLSQPEAIGGYTPLYKVYGYDPTAQLTDSATCRRIIGVQGNLWTEYVPTENHAEYMMYPRVMALAEIGWTDPGVKNYAAFRIRAQQYLDDMAQRGYHPFPLRHEVGDRPESRSVKQHLGKGKHVTYGAHGAYYPGYAAGGDSALVDGVRGNWSYQDKRWQGFIDRNRLDATIDLGQNAEIGYIGADFMQMVGPEVFFPAQVVISVSDDGVHYRELTRIERAVTKEVPIGYQTYGWKGQARARFVRYQAQAGAYGGFLFTDEIVIE